MSANKRFPVLLALILISSGIFSQEVRKDSILRQLKSAASDTNKVYLLLDLSRELSRTSAKEAITYCNEAVDLSQKLGFGRGLALAQKNAGIANYGMGEYAEAINRWTASMEAFESIGDKAGVANILSNMGAVYSSFGEDTKALDLYFQAQKAAEQMGDSLRLVTTMINIGLIYLKKESTLDEALEIYLAALPIAEAIHNNDAIGTAAVNLGETYYKRNENSKALEYYGIALDAFEKTESGNIPYTLTNIGKVYSRQGDFAAALDYQKRAYQMAKSQDAKLDMVAALLGLAETYTKQGDTKSAIAAYEEARQIASETRANFELRDAYEGLAQSFASLANYSKAYLFQKALTSIKDTINRNSNENVIARQQLSYNLDKKQAELDLRELEVQKQRVVKNAFLAGLVLILIIAFIIFRNYLDKVKTNKILDRQNAEIESLLLNILPKAVARELQEQGRASPRDYGSVSVMFTDFKGFTRIAEGLTPNDLVAELNDFFHAFDDITEKHGLEKIKTIGDSYMCAGGIPTENSTHPFDTVEAGFEMQQFIHSHNRERIAAGKEPWELRIGIHTGPVVAGVVGRKKYAYDIWGSTVNIASRLESNGEAGKVNISENTFNLVKGQFNCQYRGKISAKNLGEIDMYFVESRLETVSP